MDSAGPDVVDNIMHLCAPEIVQKKRLEKFSNVVYVECYGLRAVDAQAHS
jgi:hypothetical protein